MATKNSDRLERARCSLEGLAAGDAFGAFSEGAHPQSIARRVENRALPPAPWRFTDDTNMALSIVWILQQYGEINQDALARSFAEQYDRTRGYGPAMHRLLPRFLMGAHWKDEAQSLFGGQGSFGNGAAMRAAPVGAYFADDLDAAAEQARLSAEVTHIHPEGAAGAIAVAVAAALACNLRGSMLPSRDIFIARILPLVPGGAVREGIERARDLPLGTPVQETAAALGNGSRVTCQDTVPFALWCAGECLGNYEEALWLTLSGGGDTDTTCAMVGGIVAACTGERGIPEEWLSRREPLPTWPFEG